MTGPIDVLIVEDFVAMAEALKWTMEKSGGWVVRVANSLRDARPMIASRSPANVILDLQLPDGDGATLIPLIRGLQPGCNIIVCSGDADRDDLAGADAVYVKMQFTLDDLLRKLRPPRGAA